MLILRNKYKANDCSRQMSPLPVQRGHSCVCEKINERDLRWRDISNKPNSEILLIRIRARSLRTNSVTRFSSASLFSRLRISIKSTTTKPPKLRKRNCSVIISAASKFVLNAVSSIPPPLRCRPELTSIATNASVLSKTTRTPLGVATSRM